MFCKQNLPAIYTLPTMHWRSNNKCDHTNCTNSFDRMEMIVETEAPNIFLIPISFVRVLMVYITSPNRPRQLIRTDMPVAQLNKLALRCSVS
jgi:hypothetical protein